MSTHSGGPTEFLERVKGVWGFGHRVGCLLYPVVGSIIEMVSRRTHGQHHLCLSRVGGGLKGGSSLA